MGQVANIEYNLDNTVKKVTYSNAIHGTPGIAYTYDPNYNRVSTVSSVVGGVSAQTVTCRYNPVNGSLGSGQLAGVDVQGAFPYTVDYTSADGAAPGYDELGRLVSWRIGASNTNGIVFDDLGRVTAVTNPLGSFGYGYVGATGRLDHAAMASGTVQLSYFDNAGDNRLKEIANLDPNGNVVSQFDYAYDPAGNIATWTQANNGPLLRTGDPAYGNPQYYVPEHDGADQLTAAALYSGSAGQSVPAPSPLKALHWDYDAAGNRITAQADSAATTYIYNELNQLIGQTGGGLVHFTGTVNKPAVVTVGTSSDPALNGTANVDASGRFDAKVQLAPGPNTVTIVATGSNPNAPGGTNPLVSATSRYTVTVPQGTSGAWKYDLNGNLTEDATRTYEWDAVDRLIAISYKGTAKRTEFCYDPLGRRSSIVEKENGTPISQKHFAWNGLAMAEERNENNNVTRRFYGQGEQIAGTGANAGTFANYYYTRDHLGSIREMVDSAGSVRARYDYDLWGSRSVNLITGDGAVDSEFGFTGHFNHGPTGFAISRTRLYDPFTARWICRDPIGENGGLNLYGYVSNAPISLCDLSGLEVRPLNKGEIRLIHLAVKEFRVTSPNFAKDVLQLLANGLIKVDSEAVKSTGGGAYVHRSFNEGIYIAPKSFAFSPLVFNRMLAHEAIHEAQYYGSLAINLGWQAFTIFNNVASLVDYIYPIYQMEDPSEIFAEVMAEAIVPNPMRPDGEFWEQCP